jgi:hypothetical protein
MKVDPLASRTQNPYLLAATGQVWPFADPNSGTMSLTRKPRWDWPSQRSTRVPHGQSAERGEVRVNVTAASREKASESVIGDWRMPASDARAGRLSRHSSLPMWLSATPRKCIIGAVRPPPLSIIPWCGGTRLLYLRRTLSCCW